MSDRKEPSGIEALEAERKPPARELRGPDGRGSVTHQIVAKGNVEHILKRMLESPTAQVMREEQLALFVEVWDMGYEAGWKAAIRDGVRP